MYYRVATNEFAKSSDVYVYIAKEPTFVRVYNNNQGNLVDYTGSAIDRVLEPSSEWKTDRIAIINGQHYYRVATNEFVPVGEVYEYSYAKTNVSTDSVTSLYNERGEQLSISLPANMSYKADRIVSINGIQYYRVATNQFVPFTAVREYSNIDIQITTNSVTPVYDKFGRVLNIALPANAIYKVDRVVYINGIRYYRVAINMFIKAI